MSGRVHIWTLRLLHCFDPWSPEHIHKLPQASTGLSECNTTGERYRWGESHGIGSDVACVCEYVCVCLQKQNLKGMALSQLKVWWELGGGMKGEGSKDGDERSGKNGYPRLDSSCFFLCRVYTHGGLCRIYLLFLIVTDLHLHFWYILLSHLDGLVLSSNLCWLDFCSVAWKVKTLTERFLNWYD